MILTLLASTLLAAAPPAGPVLATRPADPDTTFAVRRGQRLEAQVHGGSITIRTWNRDAVRVRAADAGSDELDLDTDGSTISVEVSSRMGAPTVADLEITVPVWMQVAAEGVDTRIDIAGTEAPIDAETVQGDITVSGGRERIHAETVEGTVTLTDARGRLEASSVNNGITMRNVTGDASVETVNGAIEITGASLASLEASTVNGDLRYQGPLARNGRYSLESHNGRIELEIPDRSDATFEVSTFGGELESDFELRIPGGGSVRRHTDQTFTLGSGAARVEIDSFNGTIALRRSRSAAVGH